MKSLSIIFFLFFISSISLCSGAATNSLDDNSYEKNTTDHVIQDNDVTGTSTLILNQSTPIQSVFKDIRITFASYLDNPVTTLGSIDGSYFNLFHKEYNLKYYLSQHFNIPELCHVNENEPEISGILNLSWIRNEPFFLLVSLLEDITSGKKPFKALFRPLISFLHRLYNELDPIIKQNYDIYLMRKLGKNFLIHLGNICANNGHFDLVFEFINESPDTLISVLEDVKNRKGLMEFFKSYDRFALQHQSNLMTIEVLPYDNFDFHNNKNSFKWIGECIIYDAPESFYAEIIDSKPDLLMNLIECDWFISQNVPESDYPRIQSQIWELIQIFSNPLYNNFNFYKSLIDIRFGSIVMENLNHSSFNENQLLIIGKAAYFGKKVRIFHEIIHQCKEQKDFIYSIVKFIDDYSFNYQEDFLKIVFELLASDPYGLGEDYNMKFIMKHYALRNFNIDLEDDKIYFEFVAPLDSTLPSPITIEIRLRTFNYSYFMNGMFLYIKVVDEESFSSLLSAHVENLVSRKKVVASIEVIELIAKTPSLIEKIMTLGLKFLMASNSIDEFEKYLNIPNLELIASIFNITRPKRREITQFKTRNHLRIIEKMQDNFVCDFFLDYEISENRNLAEFEYFEWRLVFSHWIKGDQKERIREITSPAIIKMLTLEYPAEMRQLQSL